MQRFRFLIALLFLVQALGLSELMHAGPESCAAESSTCANHGKEGNEPQAEHDAACQWHCGSCAMGGIQLERPTLALPAVPGLKVFDGPFSFVPLAPCANIFHPPA